MRETMALDQSFEAEVFLFGSTVRRVIRFDTLELRLPDDGRWSRAQWIFSAGDAKSNFACLDVDEIVADESAPFLVMIHHPGGVSGPIIASGMVRDIPSGAHCLLYTPRFDGMWHGTALTAALGQLLMRDCGFDPA